MGVKGILQMDVSRNRNRTICVFRIVLANCSCCDIMIEFNELMSDVVSKFRRP